jgi:Kef-type K+ transport system membrane component KefB
MGRILIGPSLLSLVGKVNDVQHFAEFGVVMMLVVGGLELRLGLLWRLSGMIPGTGSHELTAKLTHRLDRRRYDETIFRQ